MSTTFGIRIPETGEVVEVAFRTDYIRWENPLAHLLPNETKVEPLDNTAQGIYTIGDIKQKITRNYDESKPNILVDKQRELLLAYEEFTSYKVLGKKTPRISKQMVEDYLANNCG
jgi:hypothetical protein